MYFNVLLASTRFLILNENWIKLFILKIIAWGNEPTINVGQAAQGGPLPHMSTFVFIFSDSSFNYGS